MFTSLFTALIASLSLVNAYTTPVGSPNGNPIFTPGLNQQVPVGTPFQITWNATTSGTVSLVLLRGPSSNAVPLSTIVEGIPNDGSYSWTPSTSLDNDSTGYGIELIVDGTGQYQYSTQFGIVNSNKAAQSSSSGSMMMSSTVSSAGGASMSSSMASISSASSVASMSSSIASEMSSSSASMSSSLAPSQTTSVVVVVTTGGSTITSAVKSTTASATPSSTSSGVAVVNAAPTRQALSGCGGMMALGMAAIMAL